MYLFLDYFFVLLHSGFVLFTLTGWVWRRTRRVHLVTVSLTLLSWFGLGIFYGWGYCPLTDWHWYVKRQLGEQDLPYSYITYYADKVTGIDWDPFLVETTTVVLAIGAFVVSCWLNWRDVAHER